MHFLLGHPVYASSCNEDSTLRIMDVNAMGTVLVPQRQFRMRDEKDGNLTMNVHQAHIQCDEDSR